MKKQRLLEVAIKAQESAHAPISHIRVGCALLTNLDNIVQGWNIEGPWMTSIHAEVCAITKLGILGRRIKMVAIASDTDFFTPCGACMDWLLYFATSATELSIQNKHGKMFNFQLKELMPHYPRK